MSKLIKVALAANEIGVTAKTIYNWVEQGDLDMPEPGKVDLSDTILVFYQKQERRASLSKLMSDRFTRDDRGRFRLLSGKLNNKPDN